MKTGDEAVPFKTNGIETKERNIKRLSKDVEAIQQQTLKKHPATISRQEYIDAHEKVYRLETELSRHGTWTIGTPSKNPRHYNMVTTQMKHPRNMADNDQSRRHRFLSVNKGKFLPVSKTRVQIVNDNFGGNTVKIHRLQRPNLIMRSEKENQEIKVSTLSTKSRPIPDASADSYAERSGSVADKKNVTATETQEPIYAQVMKNRSNKDAGDYSHGEAKLQANKSEHDTSAEIQRVNTPPVPLRMVTFKNWALDVQKRSLKNGQKTAVRPHSYHQPLRPTLSDMVWNTHVPKPIEKVYNKSASLSRSLKKTEYYRPRVSSNTFKDTKNRVALYQEDF